MEWGEMESEQVAIICPGRKELISGRSVLSLGGGTFSNFCHCLKWLGEGGVGVTLLDSFLQVKVEVWSAF